MLSAFELSCLRVRRASLIDILVAVVLDCLNILSSALCSRVATLLHRALKHVGRLCGPRWMTLIHWPTQGMKNVIDAFGFEWRVAPGEAEAELAYLHKVGIIDAVLSDEPDVGSFLFGATVIIRRSVLSFPYSASSHILIARVIGNRAHLSKTPKERTTETMLLPTWRTSSSLTLQSPSLVQAPSSLAFSQVVTASPLVSLAVDRNSQPVSPVLVSAIVS